MAGNSDAAAAAAAKAVHHAASTLSACFGKVLKPLVLQQVQATQVITAHGMQACGYQQLWTRQAAGAHLPLKGNWTGGQVGESMNCGRVSPCNSTGFLLGAGYICEVGSLPHSPT